MGNSKSSCGIMFSAASGLLLGVFSAISSAQAQTFHFANICKSDPNTKKNTVSVSLHDDWHNPLPDVTINVLWTYVDYRQNHAVFKYHQDACSTNQDGICFFNGGNGRARWQLSEVVGYDLGSPAFDDSGSVACPDKLIPADSLSIDFW